MGNKGKRFELNTKKELNANTKFYVKAHRPDFSGNSVGEAADVMVVWQSEASDRQSQNTTSSGEVWQANRYDDQKPCGHPERFVAYAELKKRSGKEGNRSTIMSGSSEKANGDMQSGLEELQELREELPPWSKRVVGIKFPRREMVVIDADVLEHWLRREQEGWGQEFLASDAHANDEFNKCERHGLRLTPSNNISMVMPEKDDWPTQSAGLAPWKKLALHVGLEEYDFQ